jgi:hypothetical protein
MKDSGAKRRVRARAFPRFVNGIETYVPFMIEHENATTVCHGLSLVQDDWSSQAP